MEDTNHTHQHEHRTTPGRDELDHNIRGPSVYVASLTDYNSGRLHGIWIDASQDANTINAAIDEMLARSPEPAAEEWAIHDHEGFAPWQPSEHEPIETIAKVAAGITEHGPAYAHLAAEIGTIDDVLDNFDEVYLGHWPSLTDYATEVLDDLIDLDRIGPDWISPYPRLDADAYARDLATELHVSNAADGGVHLFHP